MSGLAMAMRFLLLLSRRKKKCMYYHQRPSISSIINFISTVAFANKQTLYTHPYRSKQVFRISAPAVITQLIKRFCQCWKPMFLFQGSSHINKSKEQTRALYTDVSILTYQNYATTVSFQILFQFLIYLSPYCYMYLQLREMMNIHHK